MKENFIFLLKSFQTKKIVFHDPCYLGRGNDIYQEPRNILKKLSTKVVEAKKSHRNSFCCGAGGSQIFKEAEKGSNEVHDERAKQLKKTGSEIIATGCPFCKLMLTDGVKNMQEKENTPTPEVKDISELIAEELSLI